jgi:carbonic anhydrase/acetyltransferase-like protein (isoleucine patch superfamily)
MPVILPYGGATPMTPMFLAPNATLVGDVRCGAECSVWFGAVLRADINRIELGAQVNIQDNAVLHVSRKLPCVLGDRVSVGHLAICHACTVGAGTLVGMGAKVLDGALVGAGCIIAAGAVVTEGMVVPDGMVVAGVPARVVKPVPEALRARFGATADHYVAYARGYLSADAPG